MHITSLFIGTSLATHILFVSMLASWVPVGYCHLMDKMGISFRKGMEHYVTDRKNALSIMNWLSLENNICNKNYILAFSEICSTLNIKIGI